MPLREINDRIAREGYGDVTLERVADGHLYRWSNGKLEDELHLAIPRTKIRPDRDWVKYGVDFGIEARKRAYDREFGQ